MVLTPRSAGPAAELFGPGVPDELNYTLGSGQLILDFVEIRVFFGHFVALIEEK